MFSLLDLVRTNRPEDAYLTATPLLNKHLMYAKSKWQKWKQELGSEWMFLLKLCHADRSKAIESICTDLQDKTATVTDTLRKEHQSDKSYLSLLPIHIIEDIEGRLLDDMQAQLATWKDRHSRLNQDVGDAAA